jgi:hypothetical protein
VLRLAAGVLRACLRCWGVRRACGSLQGSEGALFAPLAALRAKSVTERTGGLAWIHHFAHAGNMVTVGMSACRNAFIDDFDKNCSTFAPRT